MQAYSLLAGAKVDGFNEMTIKNDTFFEKT